MWEYQIWRKVTKEQESWKTMEDLFKSINNITTTKEQTKAYNEPMYISISQVAIERINEGSYGK